LEKESIELVSFSDEADVSDDDDEEEEDCDVFFDDDFSRIVATLSVADVNSSAMSSVMSPDLVDTSSTDKTRMASEMVLWIDPPDFSVLSARLNTSGILDSDLDMSDLESI
jgi:hypothetical protein